MVMIGRVLRFGEYFLAGSLMQDFQLRDGTNRGMASLQLGIVMLLRHVDNLSRLQPGKLLNDVLRLTRHIGTSINQHQIPRRSLVITIRAVLFI